jgi:hypothetical protein
METVWVVSAGKDENYHHPLAVFTREKRAEDYVATIPWTEGFIVITEVPFNTNLPYHEDEN